MMNINGNSRWEPCNNTCNGNNIVNPFVSCFFSLPPKQFALLSSLLGILLIDSLNTEQQNSLGNFIVNVGQSILTAASQGQVQESNHSQKDQIKVQLELLKKQISMIEKDLDNKD